MQIRFLSLSSTSPIAVKLPESAERGFTVLAVILLQSAHTTTSISKDNMRRLTKIDDNGDCEDGISDDVDNDDDVDGT